MRFFNAFPTLLKFQRKRDPQALRQSRQISIMKQLLEIGLQSPSTIQSSYTLLKYLSRISSNDEFIFYRINSRHFPMPIASLNISNLDTITQLFQDSILNLESKPLTVKKMSNQLGLLVFSIYPIHIDGSLYGCILEKANSIDPALCDVSELLGVIYAQIEHKEALFRASQTDKLTGLPNLSAYDYEINQMILHHENIEAQFTYIIADIDHFKSVNDTYGHEHGDHVLQAFSDYLKHSIRNEDIVFRIGGEEFVILMPNTSPANVVNRLDSIRRGVEQMVISTSVGVNHKRIRITASFGVSTYPGDSMDPVVLKEKADKALYYSKDNGRNKCTLFASIG